MLPEHRAQVAGQVHGPDQGTVDLALLQEAECGFQGLDARTVFVGKGEAWAAYAEFTGNTAGYHTAQGPHGPVGGKGRPGVVAQLGGPVGQLFRQQFAAQLLCPGGGLLGQ